MDLEEVVAQLDHVHRQSPLNRVSRPHDGAHGLVDDPWVVMQQ
jgi:hypothetical protein